MTRHAMLSTILYRNHCKSVCTVHHTHQAGHALCRQKSTLLKEFLYLFKAAFRLLSVLNDFSKVPILVLRLGAKDPILFKAVLRGGFQCILFKAFFRGSYPF